MITMHSFLFFNDTATTRVLKQVLKSPKLVTVYATRSQRLDFMSLNRHADTVRHGVRNSKFGFNSVVTYDSTGMLTKQIVRYLSISTRHPLSLYSRARPV